MREENRRDVTPLTELENELDVEFQRGEQGERRRSRVLEGESVQTTTADGVEYEEIEPPCEVLLKVSNIKKVQSNSRYAAYSGAAQAGDITNTPLPISDSNPRSPVADKPIVNDIKKTLIERPEALYRRNNGLTIAASEVTVAQTAEDEFWVRLQFRDSEGLINGGHTSLAARLVDETEDTAILPVEILHVFPSSKKERIALTTDSAVARNSEQELEDRSIAHHKGYYSPFKNRVAKELVNWYEGDEQAVPEARTADQLIMHLSAIDPLRYHSPYSQTGDAHTAEVQSSTRVHSRWMEKLDEAITSNNSTADEDVISEKISRPFEHLYPLLSDILGLRDGIARTLMRASDVESNHIPLTDCEIRRTNFWSEFIRRKPDDDAPPHRELHHTRWQNTEGVDLSPTLETLLIGWLRHNVWLPDSDSGNLAGWRCDPLGAWENEKLDLLTVINQSQDWTDVGGSTFSRRPLLFQGHFHVPRSVATGRDPDIIQRDEDNTTFLRTNTKYDDERLLLYPSIRIDREPTHALSEDDTLIPADQATADQTRYIKA